MHVRKCSSNDRACLGLLRSEHFRRRTWASHSRYCQDPRRLLSFVISAQNAFTCDLFEPPVTWTTGPRSLLYLDKPTLEVIQAARPRYTSVASARFLNLYPSIRDPLPALHTKPAASDLADSYPNPRNCISKPGTLSLTGSQVDVVCGSSCGVRRRKSAPRVLVLGGCQERQENTRDERQERSA
jgi:hypothetical protein